MVQSQSPIFVSPSFYLSAWYPTLTLFWTLYLVCDTHYLLHFLSNIRHPLSSGLQKAWTALFLLFCHLQYILHAFRLRQTPLHNNYCPGMSYHDPGTNNMLRSLLQLKQHLHQWLPLASWGILTVVWCLWCQFFSIIPACIQNYYNVGDHCTLANLYTNLKWFLLTIAFVC